MVHIYNEIIILSLYNNKALQCSDITRYVILAASNILNQHKYLTLLIT